MQSASQKEVKFSPPAVLSLPAYTRGLFLSVKFLSLHLTAHEILHLESPSSLNFQADLASVRAPGATRSLDKHLNG